MKRSFFQAAVTSILLYGCTTWTLKKRLEKKLDGNYTRMLRAILNKSWQQHSTRHQLYGHLPPITKTIQVRRTRHAGHCWRSRDETHKRCTLMDPHTWPRKKQDDQLERTFSSYVRIQVVVLKTYLGRWTIGRKWRERVMDIRAASTIWWWWWWTIVGYLMPNPLHNIYIINILDLVWLDFMAYQPLFGYLMPNPLHTYISNILDLVWLCFMAYQTL